MPRAGLEPARGFPLRILSPLCLPFHHPGKDAKVYRAGFGKSNQKPAPLTGHALKYVANVSAKTQTAGN